MASTMECAEVSLAFGRPIPDLMNCRLFLYGITYGYVSRVLVPMLRYLVSEYF